MLVDLRVDCVGIAGTAVFGRNTAVFGPNRKLNIYNQQKSTSTAIIYRNI